MKLNIYHYVLLYDTILHINGTILLLLYHQGIYNTSSFGADIVGTKNVRFEELNLYENTSLAQLAFVKPFKFELDSFVQEEFYNINQVIAQLSKGAFSPALVNAIVKSASLYQYMQADVLAVLQRNFATEQAEEFIDSTKFSIKKVVELYQKTKLI